ncbi:hypothetical protein DK26_19395 [Bosea sp. WAO]|nr:hypothetical protein DK26_19395 [Bosea sp. WAO]
MDEVRLKLAQTAAELHTFTLKFGDELGRKPPYKGLDGMDAIVLYLVNKHHWLPADVRAISQEDLRIVLNEELSTKP